jgi:hypothetical protein
VGVASEALGKSDRYGGTVNGPLLRQSLLVDSALLSGRQALLFQAIDCSVLRGIGLARCRSE